MNISITMCLINSVEKSVTRHRQTTINLLEYASLNRSDDVFNDVTIKAGDWVYFFAVKIRTNVRICSKNFGHLKIFSARFMNE